MIKHEKPRLKHDKLRPKAEDEALAGAVIAIPGSPRGGREAAEDMTTMVLACFFSRNRPKWPKGYTNCTKKHLF